MARIAGVNIPNHQHIVIGLTAIFGIGRPRAEEICAATGVDPTKKVKDLDDNDLEKLRDEIGKFVIEGDLRREVSMSIKRLMDPGLLSWFASSQRVACQRSTYPYKCANQKRST